MSLKGKVLTRRTEVGQAAHELNLTELQFRILPREEAGPILDRIETHFVTKKGLSWWWEHFQSFTTARARFVDGSGWRYLTRILPPDSGQVWFVVDDDSEFVLCEGTIESVQSVIGQCRSYEYYVVSKSLDWLLCENDADNIYAIGEVIPARLTELMACVLPHAELVSG